MQNLAIKLKGFDCDRGCIESIDMNINISSATGLAEGTFFFGGWGCGGGGGGVYGQSMSTGQTTLIISRRKLLEICTCY